jgi:glycosyltransferase involved in cell wall biosynthesis
MRVVHVPRRFTAAVWGGTETYLRELGAGLAEAGLEQAIYTSSALEQATGDRCGSLPVRRFPHHYPEWFLSAERRARYDNKGGNLLSPQLCRQLRRDDELDLIHLHTGGRLGATCLRVARKRGIPCVLTLHGGHFCIPPAEQASIAAADTRPGIEWGRALNLLLRTKELLSRVDALVCVGIDEYHAAEAALPGQRVELIPGGVEPRRYAEADGAAWRAAHGFRPGDRLIVCAARLDAQKDQLCLVQAWTALAWNNCHLILAGAETSPGYAEKCRSAAGHHAERLHILGNLPSDEVPQLLAAAEVCVLPSRHEPFGLACLEAWAAGKPLLAADVGGPGWLIGHEQNGLLFPAGDSAACADAMNRLLTQPVWARQLGVAGQRCAVDQHSWQGRVQQHLDLYRELCEAGGRPKPEAKNASRS